LPFDRGRTRPNKTVKCNTWELTQSYLPVTKPFIQSFPDAIQHTNLSSVKITILIQSNSNENVSIP